MDVDRTATHDALALARDTLAAAETLANAGFARHAVGRSYYAVYHAACALLATVGLRARFHEGMRSLVNEHFVRTGVLAHEHARTLRQLAGDRNDVDYDAAATFTDEDARHDIERACAFVGAVASIASSRCAWEASYSNTIARKLEWICVSRIWPTRTGLPASRRLRATLAPGDGPDVLEVFVHVRFHSCPRRIRPGVSERE